MESLETLQDTARKAGEKIERIETARRREANGTKVGKFYKTRNNYSCPKKASDYWWQYEKVTRMDSRGFLRTLQFQTDSYGTVHVEFEHYAYHMQYGTEIKKAEFDRAWKTMQAKIKAAH